MATKLDNTLTKQDMLNKSYQILNSDDLYKIFLDTTITGRYLYNNTWYIYKVNSFADGTIEGQNDVGSYNEGRWKINSDGSMSVEWDGYWEDWTGFAYEVNKEIMFFDATTGAWRTTYTLIEAGQQSTDI